MRQQPLLERHFTELAASEGTSEFSGVLLTRRIIAADGLQLSGDWGEWYPVSDDVIALSIGDVCGHGAHAFFAMEAVRASIRDTASRRLGPAQVLAAANVTLCKVEPHCHVTSILALLDTRRRELIFANAGHPTPLLTCLATQRFLGPALGSLPLGIDPTARAPEQTVRLPADALLVFYTDGVTERSRDAIRGLEDLSRAATFAHHYSALPAASVIERQMFLTGPNRDDAAILTARMPAGAERASL